MNKAICIFAAMVFCILLSACATTGDPNCIGLFCFNEDEYKKHQAELKRELAHEEGRRNKLLLEQQQLETSITAKKQELEALEQKVASLSSSPSAAEAEQIRPLKKRIAQLKKEITELEKEEQDLISVL